MKSNWIQAALNVGKPAVAVRSGSPGVPAPKYPLPPCCIQSGVACPNVEITTPLKKSMGVPGKAVKDENWSGLPCEVNALALIPGPNNTFCTKLGGVSLVTVIWECSIL